MKIIKTGQTRSDARRILEVFVSDEDYQRLANHNWQALKEGSIYTRINGRSALMHRLILNAPENMEVDHIDGNRLNNQRSNLRLCNSSQNKCNRGPRKDNNSGYKGVIWNTLRNVWQSHIKIPNGKYLYLGAYSDIKEAANAYNVAARKYHGEFAFINSIQ